MRQLQNDTIFEELYHLAEINGKYQQRRNLKGVPYLWENFALDEVMN